MFSYGLWLDFILSVESSTEQFLVTTKTTSSVVSFRDYAFDSLCKVCLPRWRSSVFCIFFLVVLRFYDLHLDLWFILYCYIEWEAQIEFFLFFFCIWTSTCTTIYLKVVFSSIDLLWFLCWKTVDHMCVSYFCGLCCPIGLCCPFFCQYHTGLVTIVWI